MEVEHQLLNKKLKIIQNTDWFNFSLDSVLLANFVTLNKDIKKVIDFCTGNAPIPLLLTERTNAQIYGIELQREIFLLAQKTIGINDLGNKVKIINDDVGNIFKHLEMESFDVITCNPPYFKIYDNSNFNDNDIKTNARHETKINLDIIFDTAKKLLKNGGVIAMVHRPERLVEIIEKMKENNIEPKRLQFIYPKEDTESNMILIEGKKNGNDGLKILKPIYVHEQNGNYRKEIKKLFE